MLKWFKRFRKSEKGQGMVEYGLILALVSIVALGALGGIGGKLNDTFEQVVGAVSGGEVIPEDEILYTNEDIDNLVKEEYIPISTADELNSLRTNTTQTFGQGTKWSGTYTSGLDKKYIQVANIDLRGVDNFEPIGTLNNEFTGTFDGGGYVISNLTINRGSEDYVGLFGLVNKAAFKNVGLEKVNVTGGSNTGGLVGYQSNSSKVLNSYATGEVSGGSYTGGLVGHQHSSSTTNSYATGSVNGRIHTGGLVGYQTGSSTVSNSYATGSVTGTGNQVGGLVGHQHSSSTTNSYATGSVNGTGSHTGGLVGYQQTSSTVSNSYATGKVTGGSSTGGLVGYQDGSSTVSNNYYDKDTTKRSDTGKGTGKITAEMKKKETYVDWDFDSIWTIESNQYPTHR